MLRAFIFDCDGVLVDSEPVHLRCFKKILAEEEVMLTDEEYFDKFLAMDDHDCFKAVLEYKGREVDEIYLDELIKRKVEYFPTQMVGEPPTFRGVVDFVRNVSSRYPVAIASGALRHEIKFAVEGLEIADCFRFFVSAEDVAHGKPDPESYQTALTNLNGLGEVDGELLPQECIVVEDSVHGVNAAKGAGMFCLAVTNSYPPEKLGDADWVVAALSDFDIDEAERQMG